MRVTHIPGVRGGREDGRHGGNQPEREHEAAEQHERQALAVEHGHHVASFHCARLERDG